VTEKLKLFRLFALSSVLATYLLIFIGGLVRVSGAGLGCPDWPKCFGRWIPPLSINQLPTGIDPASVNLTLAWIEYINRLAGMITGILILITALLALKNFRNNKKIVIPSVLAAIVVAFQGWYGSLVVKSQLMPLTISIHLFLALLIISLLLYTLINAYYFDQRAADKSTKTFRNLLRFLWLAAIIQILIGTELRSEIEIVWQKYPLLSSLDVLQRVGSVSLIHALLGIGLSTGTLVATIRLVKTVSSGGFIRNGFWLLNGLILFQLLIGFALQIGGILPLIQVFHLWIASLLIGLILVIYTSLLYQQEG